MRSISRLQATARPALLDWVCITWAAVLRSQTTQPLDCDVGGRPPFDHRGHNRVAAAAMRWLL